jgi:hypothetical protein
MYRESTVKAAVGQIIDGQAKIIKMKGVRERQKRPWIKRAREIERSRFLRDR